MHLRQRVSACVCAQKIKRPDAKNCCVQMRLLFKDFQDVLYICFTYPALFKYKQSYVGLIVEFTPS